MSRRWLGLLLLLSLGLNVGVFGTLFFKRSEQKKVEARGPEWMRPRLARIADRLELEGSDRLRFLEAQRAFIATVQRERRHLERARAELRRELTSQQPDRARVETLLVETADRSEALDRAFVENVLVVREVLDGNKEQRYLRFLSQIHSRGARPGNNRAPRGR